MAAIPFTGPLTTASSQCPVLPDGAQAVTPSNTDTFQGSVAIFVGGAGTVVCTPANGGADVTVTMPAGAIVPFRVLAVKTASTATLMLAIY